MIINICEDFTNTPGARYKSEGEFSGEEFRETLLEPKFLEAQKNKEKLIVNLDGGYGYPTSFLEEAFGGLARIYGSKEVQSVIELVSNDEPAIIDEIRGYITKAKKEE